MFVWTCRWALRWNESARTVFFLEVPPIRISLIGFEIRPSVYMNVLQTDNSVIFEADGVTVRGSPLVESVKFDMTLRTEMTWKDTPDEKVMFSTARMDLWAMTPSVLKIFPKSVLESASTLAIQVVMDQLMGVFMKNLGKDYEKWALDRTYRESRASECVVPKAKQEVMSPAAAQSLTQASAQIISITGENIITFLVGSAVAFAALRFRRRRLTAGAGEEPLLAASGESLN